MAETPSRRSQRTPKKQKVPPPSFSDSSPSCHVLPPTPQTLDPSPRRRSLRLTSTPQASTPPPAATSTRNSSRRKSLKFASQNAGNSSNQKQTCANSTPTLPSPASPEPVQSRRKRKLTELEKSGSEKTRALKTGRKKVYYKKVVYDGGEFAVGDDVYVKRREDASSDDEDPEVEECKVCFMAGRAVMIECDDCLGGFHLKCLNPPLKEVPEGDWICGFCEATKLGKTVQLPVPPKGKKRARTAREKMLASDLYAARIESIWKDVDGTYRFKAHWYIIPEETAAGRQPHNLRRELYRTNDFADAEMESIIRHCYILTPKEFSKANNGGDDVFLCEYEYDIHWHSFKRIADIDDGEEDCEEVESDREWNSAEGSGSDSEDDVEYEEENKEMEEITAFIKGSICEYQCLGKCLYIHGVPGTGKTMSVLSVMRNLKSEVDAGSIKPYCFVEINGLKLASPEHIYSVIYEALNGHRVGWKKALKLLNERFSNGTERGKEDNRPCILLIDELDLLVTRNQSVLYNILDWPTKPHSRLIIIGIANTMDLPEKLLPRISSRMGIQRLCFGPYNYQQLQEIISTRLNGINAFEKPAIEFASRKVAAVSGDARRALEICRRAAELADYRVKKVHSSAAGKELVGMADVEAAIHEMFQAPHIQVMRSSSRFSKIFLAAMVYELHKTGMSETTFEKLAMTVSCLCTSNGEKFPGWDSLLKVGCMLGECRVLLCEPGVKHKLQKLQLNFPSDDVAFALKESKDLPWLAKYL
ncbi:PREDICTED: origin of replication complex subunit 1B-like isoform X3 [Ipomoea nil]|uniref:origin of replication complex subunit 1B-like isoform X3 n=1 Tax=Ipomoea nil TaxID=35883 RepID=UPI000900CC37|nr:PREDICTED: origin of replication complex subunit 1B-like isoform X3 [Ipomoea nil]